MNTQTTSAKCIAALATALTAVTMTVAAPAARASNLDFNLMNSTGEPIVALWVSPSGYGRWGRSFNNTFVPQGGSQRVSFDYGSYVTGACYHDVRIQFAQGAVRFWQNVNLCSVSGFRVYVAGGMVRGITY